MRLFFLLLICAPALASNEIALVQYDSSSHFGDTDANLRALTRFAENAVSQGAQLIVLPEGAIQGYANAERLWCSGGRASCGGKRCEAVERVAETIPEGPISRYWQDFARAHRVYISFNLPESAGTGFYNTTAVLGPEGLVARYRKRSLYYVDVCYAAPGRDEAVFDTPFGRFGMLTCADVNEVSWISHYSELGANAVLLTTDWDENPEESGAERPARLYFARQASRAGIDILAADNSPWDGTGRYFARGGKRERDGLAEIAIGVDGVSLHGGY